MGSGGPGPETAPRGTKSTTFAKGIFQPSDLRNMGTYFEIYGSIIGVWNQINSAESNQVNSIKLH